MSDYTNTFGGAAKDAANSTILGSELDTELNNVQNMSTTKANKVAGATTDNLGKLTGTGDIADSGLKTSKTPQVDAVVTFEKTVKFSSVIDTGTGGSYTFNWTLGNKQKRTLNANATFTFTTPGGPCNLVLQIYNSGASRTITWPGTVKWADAVTPTPSGSGKTDIYAFYFDGTNYYGAASLNYS